MAPDRPISILQSWVRAQDPATPFVWAGGRCLTYGDVTGRPPPRPGQVEVEPGGEAETIVELMTVPGSGRQLVVVDPRLPAGEKRRRREKAAPATDREALTILFTSGTTGPAKAVRLTAGNWLAAARASAAHLAHRPDDVWLAAMPLHHVGGLSILYRTAFVGGSVRWLPRFEPAEVSEELRGRVTIASLVPTMLRRVLDHDRGSFSGVRAVLVGGGPIPAGLLEEAHQRGLPVLPTYGMTETCAQVATLRPGSPPRHAAHPLPGLEVRIGDDERIEVRGAQVSPGYADQDDLPPGSWFTTPDRGRLEEDGALAVLGRADRVIVTGGENVDPSRVEAVLLEHPDVESAAVVGIEDPGWGMTVAAAYTGGLQPVALQAWAATRLAPYERPKVLRRLAWIPTLAPGKPDHPAVAELLARTDDSADTRP